MYYRMFSKNYSKRYSEKMAYLEYSNKVKVYLDKNKKDKSQRKEFRFYKCPSCKQKVRVPRGKGKMYYSYVLLDINIYLLIYNYSLLSK